MSLIPCPECGREISTAAEVCPHCGYPIRPSTPAPAGPKCYACSAVATTRCQKCNKLSCAQHVKSIYVFHGEGGAYELRCKACYGNAESWNTIRWILIGTCVLIAVFILILTAGRH